MGVYRFEDLRVWQEARRLSDDLVPIMQRGPFRRDIKLRDQIGNAVVSVMANIAEGFLRQSRKEFAQYARTAFASNGELRSHLYIAEARGLITSREREELGARSESIARMLRRLIERLET